MKYWKGSWLLVNSEKSPPALRLFRSRVKALEYMGFDASQYPEPEKETCRILLTKAGS